MTRPFTSTATASKKWVVLAVAAVLALLVPSEVSAIAIPRSSTNNKPVTAFAPKHAAVATATTTSTTSTTLHQLAATVDADHFRGGGAESGSGTATIPNEIFKYVGLYFDLYFLRIL